MRNHLKLKKLQVMVAIVDAPYEIIDKGMPKLIEAKFSNMLPASMTASEKKNYLDTKITPIVRDHYDACIASSKKRINYSTSIDKKINGHKGET